MKHAIQQLDQLRAEWAKAPFMTKQMAGAYFGPLLDLLETMRLDTALLSAELDDMKRERERVQLEAASLIAACAESQALPAWMLERLQRMQGGQHGA